MSLFCLYFWGIMWSPFCSLLTHCSGWFSGLDSVSKVHLSFEQLESLHCFFNSSCCFFLPAVLRVSPKYTNLRCAKNFRSGGSPGTEDCPSPGSLHVPHPSPGICKQEVLWLYFLCVGVLKLLQSRSLDAQKATYEPHVCGLCFLI